MKFSNRKENKMNVKDPITRLNLKENVVDTLKSNKIRSLKQLRSKTKADLRLLDLKKDEIKKIEIELQLQGFDLKK